MESEGIFTLRDTLAAEAGMVMERAGKRKLSKKLKDTSSKPPPTKKPAAAERAESWGFHGSEAGIGNKAYLRDTAAAWACARSISSAGGAGRFHVIPA